MRRKQTQFPELMKYWEERLEKTSCVQKVHYECANLFLMIIKDHRDITLLDIIREGDSVLYRFDKIHIRFQPNSPRMGTIFFRSEKHMLEKIQTIFIIMMINFKPTRKFRDFDPSRIVQKYEIRKMLHEMN